MLGTGDVLDGKYRILHEIGRGGMSVVYLAINERANRMWAVKEFRKDGVMDFAAVRTGLIAETELMKRLRHPNLPGIVDVIDQDDTFFVVMDYIEGISLDQLLKTEGAQPESRVIRWAKQLCGVLGYLHGQDPPVIYRDLKPSNIMLRPDGTLCLIDFGTARELKDREKTEDTVCLGTRGYAAPEQFGGRGQTDARTDIYCLGATLYHLLTGHSPAEPPYEIKPLRYWDPGSAGTGLEKLIRKCTRQDPAGRYQCCEELMDALEHYREEDDAERRKRKRRLRVFSAACAAGALALLGMLLFHGAKVRAVNGSYESLLNTAMFQEDLQEAETWLLQALERDAGKADAYELLMKKAGAEIVREDRLTARTARIINECLTKRPHGSVTNLEVLQKEDPNTYAKLMYELGLWYFFLKDNTEEDRQNASVNYLSRITSEEQYLAFLTPGEREMTRILEKIGSYTAGLRTRLGKAGSGTESTYSALFEDLETIVSGDLRARVGRDYYCIAVYQRIAAWIDKEVSGFKAAGVSREKMRKMLDEIDSGLRSLGITDENDSYEEYESALETVESAKRTVELTKW